MCNITGLLLSFYPFSNQPNWSYMKKELSSVKSKGAPKQQSVNCLGPLADLEKHLPGDWWKHLFNSIYLKTDADVVENEENTNQEIALVLELTGVEPNDRILDLCCGQGRHTLALSNKGFTNIVGLDRSRYLIRLAKKRASVQLASRVQFREGDARKVPFPANWFNLVMLMGNSFGYFEREDENQAVLHEVYRLLGEGGTIFLDITDGHWMKNNYAPRSWEWIDQQLMVCRERNLSKDGLKLVSREVVVDAQKGIIADQFYAERLYHAEELEERLKKAGFTEITFHSTVQAKSDRNLPDLGMMASRFLITALVRNKPLPPPKKTISDAQKVRCTVLLGDPALPDRVKLHGRFNKEDFETINKLKGALQTLTDYKFTFIDDHTKLVAHLLHQKPAFVFNLCDEGFRNDAFMELHIPALLEMCEIPYSGAGPTCLGICYNKGLVTAWAKEMGIATPDEIWIDSENSSTALPSDFPVLIKPVYGDSSMGIRKEALVNSADSLVSYVDNLRQEFPGIPILVQEFLQGREFTVALIGNPGRLTCLPILEVDYSNLPADLPHILGYESKWEPDSPYWSKIVYRRAELTEEQARELIDHSMLLFGRLGCRDYARFDYRMDSRGAIKLLEVNPNPGWCWDGKMNFMAEIAGQSYAEHLADILSAARQRYNL